MTDEEFKAELALFAGLVEEKKPQGILVDVSRFRHRPGPGEQPWRVQNISNRYHAAGVKRFAFLFPEGAQIPPMMNQSAPGEFCHRSVHQQEASNWMVGRIVGVSADGVVPGPTTSSSRIARIRLPT